MIKLITHPDIGCDDIQKVIADELVNQDKFIYLTATMSLKSIANDIMQYDFSNAQMMPSNYGTYCRPNDVCLER